MQTLASSPRYNTLMDPPSTNSSYYYGVPPPWISAPSPSRPPSFLCLLVVCLFDRPSMWQQFIDFANILKAFVGTAYLALPFAFFQSGLAVRKLNGSHDLPIYRLLILICFSFRKRFIVAHCF